LKIKKVLAFEIGGGSDHAVMQDHVQEERILNNTVVKDSNLIVLSHQFSSPLERNYWQPHYLRENVILKLNINTQTFRFFMLMFNAFLFISAQIVYIQILYL
jgi:HD superfamily phosphodiesterase